ncbi:hypothetical protein RT97_09075 [Variovorax paradoxus]|uniref:TonB-dependent receptor n=1 Tax=Variovorax paradoxus TaxID=34073 RepID=A0A0D0LXF2_VARPD|nr:hypothetical protein [Variovorax paradoxus]KIQ33968.1 hypothetical protein RT97_09075 [Variovorax paradoxus]
MIFQFTFSRKTLALCLGSLLLGASSAHAVEATSPQSSEQNALVETLLAPARAERVRVEETGAYGVDMRDVKRHLTTNLKTDTGLFPRSEPRFFLDGGVKMDYQVARPAIDSPFGNERALVELPKVSNAFQRAIRAMSTN